MAADAKSRQDRFDQSVAAGVRRREIRSDISLDADFTQSVMAALPDLPVATAPRARARRRVSRWSALAATMVFGAVLIAALTVVPPPNALEISDDDVFAPVANAADYVLGSLSEILATMAPTDIAALILLAATAVMISVAPAVSLARRG